MRDYIINPERVNTRVNFIFGRLVVQLRLLRLSKAYVLRVFGATALNQCQSVIEHTLRCHWYRSDRVLSRDMIFEHVILLSNNHWRKFVVNNFFNTCETMFLKYSIFCHHLTFTSVSLYIKPLDPNILSTYKMSCCGKEILQLVENHSLATI